MPGVVVWGQLLGVELLDQPEAAELALLPVEVAVVVRVPGDEAVPANAVEQLDVFDDVNGERQARDPGPAGFFVA